MRNMTADEKERFEDLLKEEECAEHARLIMEGMMEDGNFMRIARAHIPDQHEDFEMMKMWHACMRILLDKYGV